MRLFTAIGLPNSVSEALASAAPRLLPREGSGTERIRRTLAANMHVTLSFLGSVDPARVDAIRQALTTVRASRLRLKLDGPELLVPAGVLVARVQPSPALLALAEQVAAALEACGFARERRPYSPHVTLARTKGHTSSAAAAGHAAFHQTFEADAFHLYQSFTLPEGPRYQVLSTFPLG